MMPAFAPLDIPLVPRAASMGLTKIRESLSSSTTRAIAIVAPGGYGKTVLLGELYSQLRGEVGWIGVLRGADIAVPDDVHALGYELAHNLTGLKMPLFDLVESLTHSDGRGLILFDALDRILASEIIPVVHTLFADLQTRGVTLVFSCRDYEYRAFLDPLSASMPRLSGTFALVKLDSFNSAQVEAAVYAYIAQHLRLTPERARQFVDRILNLRFDNYQIAELARIPLLLSVLCKLYGPQGYVPTDLTVSGLWADYWDRCVRKAGRTAPDTQAAIAREDFCYLLASELLHRSKSYLLLFLHDRRIGFSAQPIRELLSEGVLTEETNDRIGFFHQTLLEYAIARWLLSRDGEKDEERIIAATKATTEWPSEVRHFIWPIVRQYVSICEIDHCSQIITDLDWNNYPAVRAVLLGAVTRGDTVLLETLATRVIREPPHQRLFLEAIRSVDAAIIPGAWNIVLDLIDRGDERNAEFAAETLATLAVRVGTVSGILVKRMIDLLSKKRFTVDTRDMNFIMARFLDELPEGSIPAEMLETIRDSYDRFSPGLQVRIVELHLTHGAAVAQRDLLASAKAMPLPEILQPSMARLISSAVSAHESLSELQRHDVKGWKYAWSEAAGRWAVNDPDFLQELLNGFLAAASSRRHGYTMALRKAIEFGAGQSLLDHVEKIPVGELIGRRGRLSDFAELMEAWSGTLDIVDVNRLRQYTQALRPLTEPQAVSGWICLWQNSEEEMAEIISSLERLSPPQLRQTLLRVIHNAPPTVLMAVAPRFELLLRKVPSRFWDVLPLLIQKAVDVFPDAVSRLVVLGTGSASTAALAAARAIRDLAEGGHAIQAYTIKLLGNSKVAGVQQHWSYALLAIFENDDISADEMIATAQLAARHDTDHQAKIVVLDLTRRWIRRHKHVPSGVVNALGDMIDEASKQRRFMIGHINLIKAAGEFADDTDLGVIEEVLIRVIRDVDLDTIHTAEHEMSDSIKAIGRRDPRFLARLVARLDLARMEPRNIRALVFAARHLEGDRSIILDEIEKHPSCPPAVRSAIARIRAGE